MGDGMFMAGYLGAAIAETKEKTEPVTREQIIAELMAEGILLPEFDWESPEFVQERDSIALDWFERHPEIKRGTGALEKLYPQVIALEDTLIHMSGLGRITPKEYITIYREAFNF